ncbi:hypothetical protein F5Y15DRAFT_91762 [Xylariaceae sp. FL0016]|nr:hypothetical protein F5Y15DRAFT_91762 [Xylariaceae sp. FL0016]
MSEASIAGHTDWLAPLRTAAVIFIAAIKFLAVIVYSLSAPLRYPLYYVCSFVAFLLSPIRYMLALAFDSMSLVMNVANRLKYIYVFLASAALIGILAAIVLRGTSSIIFVLLGISPSASPPPHKPRSQQDFPSEDDQDQDYYYEDSTSSRFSSTPKSGRLLRPPRRQQADQDIKTEATKLLDRQWKLLRTAEKPRRRRGLLAQTIHEESTESDFS